MGNGGLDLNDRTLWPKLIWDVKLSIKIAPTGPYQQSRAFSFCVYE